MSNIDKQALTDEAISKAFAGTNFGRNDFKNILAETVIDAAAGWRCGYTATTICTQLGLLTPKGCASALGLRFISEHVQRETKRLKDELEAAEKRVAELEAIAKSVKFDPIPMEDLGNKSDGKKHPYMFGAGYNSAVVHCESVLLQAFAAAAGKGE
ncbi:hypothetical protein [Enterobacter vonholyi]